MRKIDLVGERFGRLKVIKESGKKGNSITWECICDCGIIKDIRGEHLRSGVVTSCGCAHSDMLKKRNTNHGMTGTKLFNIWNKLKAKCYTETSEYYGTYGARNIKMLPDWIGENGFIKFKEWAISAGYEDGMELYQKNKNMDFEPKNLYFKRIIRNIVTEIEFEKNFIIEGEEWKDINCLNGNYKISNFGRIKSVERVNSYGRLIREKIIVPYLNTKEGYLIKKFYVNQKQIKLLVHRMVAEAFIENPHNLPLVNHKDENKINNNVNNLEWCSHSYNVQYSNNRHGYLNKKVARLNEYSEILEIYSNIKEAGESMGLKNPYCITQCCRGMIKSSGGYKWKYIN